MLLIKIMNTLPLNKSNIPYNISHRKIMLVKEDRCKFLYTYSFFPTREEEGKKNVLQRKKEKLRLKKKINKRENDVFVKEEK